MSTLQSLVDKSLLRHTEERLWMLETVRTYGAERLEASGEGEMQALSLSGGRARRAIEEGWLRDAVLMLEEAHRVNRETGDRWRLTDIASGLAREAASRCGSRLAGGAALSFAGGATELASHLSGG